MYGRSSSLLVVLFNCCWFCRWILMIVCFGPPFSASLQQRHLLKCHSGKNNHNLYVVLPWKLFWFLRVFKFYFHSHILVNCSVFLMTSTKCKSNNSACTWWDSRASNDAGHWPWILCADVVLFGDTVLVQDVLWALVAPLPMYDSFCVLTLWAVDS